jgi:hypothetical protein
MKSAAKLCSLLGLALTIVPSALVLAGRLTWTQHADAMLLGAVLWFACAPFWLGRKRAGPET